MHALVWMCGLILAVTSLDLVHAQVCTQTYDIAFALDASSSVGETNFNLLLSTLQNIVRRSLSIGDTASRVAMMTFSNTARIYFYLNRYNSADDIAEEIGRVTYESGNTNTADAIRMARNVIFQTYNGDRTDRSNILVLFTDGESDNIEQTIQQAREAKLAGVTIVTVGIGGWLNMFELNNTASFPLDQSVFRINDIATGSSTLENYLYRLLCTGMDGCNQRPCQFGGQCVAMPLGYQCDCPASRGGVNCQLQIQQSKYQTADIAIAIDSSLSRDMYGLVLNFVRNFINSLNIGRQTTRVAVVSFGDTAQVRFDLNAYQNKANMIDAISFMEMADGTNYARVLDALTYNVFHSSRGDRYDMPNIAIIITNGYTQYPDETLAALTRFRQAGNSLVVIGTEPRNSMNMRRLEMMADSPQSENMFIVNSYMDLDSYYERIFSIVFQGVDACYTNPCQGNGECVSTLNGYQCTCPTGRTGQLCERACEGTIDLGFLLDSSGSITWENFPYLLEFAANVTENFEIRSGKTNVGVVLYADQSNLKIRLSDYTNKQDLISAITELRYEAGETNTANAIQLLTSQIFSQGNGDRYNARNVLILVTDAHDTINAQATLPAAISARENDIHIIVVGLEMVTPSLEIGGIASEPHDTNIFSVSRIRDLSSLVDQVVAATCIDSNVCRSNPCRNGGQCTPQPGSYYCVCRDRYTGTDCSRDCGVMLDVVFVLDISGSIESVIDMQKLTKSIIRGLNFDGSRTRVGLLTYQNRAQAEFNLNRYTRKDSVLNAIAFAPRSEQGTNTAEALSLMRNNMFRYNSGDRTGVDNIAIVMTDGQSNINAQNTIPNADSARNEGDGIRIIAVGMGQGVNNGEIEGIANKPSSTYAFYMPDSSQIDNVANNILNLLCI